MNGKIIISILYISLTILTLWGLIFLTELSFGTKMKGNKAEAPDNMTSTKLNIAKLTVSLVWLQIIVTSLYTIVWVIIQEQS